MKGFMDSEFLLHGETASRLFHEYAKEMPIFDYHNHLSAREICNRTRYENIAQVWLSTDHYKWRAMRGAGVEERFITGEAADYDRFYKWAETVEKLPGSPLYHWTHLELQRYFGIEKPLSVKSAPFVWEECNRQLRKEGFNAYELLKHMKVKALCTTDEPFDSLEWHQKIQKDPTMDIRVLPTFRPDRILHVEDAGFRDAVTQMEERFGLTISSIDDLKKAISLAIDHFKQAGCLLSDHGFGDFTYSRTGCADAVMEKALTGGIPATEESAAYKGEMLRFLAGEYTRAGMAMQVHIGALRDNNRTLYKKLGANIGCDSIGRTTDPAALSTFLDDLFADGILPNTVLYCLNPGDYPMLSTMAGNFSCGGQPGKVQLGSAWWFNDHVRGIEAQIDELLETGLLASFTGMVTDSRSFTSFCRHEYFRRILCNKLGTIVEKGEYPCDMDILGNMVQDICFHNAAGFFRLEEK